MLLLFCYACLLSMPCFFFCTFNLSSLTSPLTSATCVASSLSIFSLWRTCGGSGIPKMNAEGTAQRDRVTLQPGSTSAPFGFATVHLSQPSPPRLVSTALVHPGGWTFVRSHEIAQYLYSDFPINLLSCCSWNISFNENPKYSFLHPKCIALFLSKCQNQHFVWDGS